MAKTHKLEIPAPKTESPKTETPTPTPLIREFVMGKGTTPSRMVLRGSAASDMVKSLGIEVPADVTLGTVVASNAVRVDAKGVTLPLAFTVYGKKVGSIPLAQSLEAIKLAYAGKSVDTAKV